MIVFRRVAVVLVAVSAGWGQEPAVSTPEPGAKIWVGRHQEIEEYLRTAECVSMKSLGSNFAAQCALRPGGPITRMAWRSQPPGSSRGFSESYKTEIAAYELDKLLKMDMVPPTVERQLQDNMGAAQLWVENVVSATDPAVPEGANRAHWQSQLVRMAMFDSLIGNRARNQGNMLRDRAWNLILIDQSRAFGTDTTPLPTPDVIDRGYWERIEKLTRKQLDAVLRPWLDDSQIGAILERRERMRAEIKSRSK